MSHATGFLIQSSPKKSRTGLATYKLDGSVIIAEAIKDSSYQLELIEDLLASLETRRDKAFGTHRSVSRRVGCHAAQDN